MKKSLFVLTMMCCLLIFTGGITANISAANEGVKNVYRGVVTEISSNRTFEVSQIPGYDYGYPAITFAVDVGTVLNAPAGLTIDIGAYVEVTYNGILSDSKPPRGTAQKIRVISASTKNNVVSGTIQTALVVGQRITLSVVPFSGTRTGFLNNFIVMDVPEDALYEITRNEIREGAQITAILDGAGIVESPLINSVLCLYPYSPGGTSTNPEATYRGKLLEVTQEGMLRVAQLPGDDFGHSEMTFHLAVDTAVETTQKIAAGAWLEVTYSRGLSDTTPPLATATKVRFLADSVPVEPAQAPATNPTLAPALEVTPIPVPESAATNTITGTIKHLSMSETDDIVVALLPAGTLEDTYSNYVFLIIPSFAMGDYSIGDIAYGRTLSANYNDVTVDAPERYAISTIRSLSGEAIKLGDEFEAEVPNSPASTPSSESNEAKEASVPQNMYRGKLTAVDTRNETITLAQIPGDDFGYSEVVFHLTEATVVTASEPVGIGAWIEIEYDELTTNTAQVRANALTVQVLAATAPSSSNSNSSPATESPASTAAAPTPVPTPVPTATPTPTPTPVPTPTPAPTSAPTREFTVWDLLRAPLFTQ